MALAAMAAAYAWWVHEPQPTDTSDLCAIFEEKGSWYRHTKRSARLYGVPEAVQMAILHQESGLNQRARPPRRRILKILPGPRPSTAYGYAQALDSTWEEYRERTGRSRARRDRFGDAAHFVGWYGREIHRLTGVKRTDARGLYLAYHEGPGGYRRGTHLGKSWLLRTADRVGRRADRYARQLDGCRERLERWMLWPWFLVAAAVAVGGGILWTRRGPAPRRRRRRN
ncbi:MAG: hypothetical protein AAGN66_29600 [Acidobacteriota bacterium]